MAPSYSKASTGRRFKSAHKQTTAKGTAAEVNIMNTTRAISLVSQAEDSRHVVTEVTAVR